jgi:hypothetical protein
VVLGLPVDLERRQSEGIHIVHCSYTRYGLSSYIKSHRFQGGCILQDLSLSVYNHVHRELCMTVFAEESRLSELN